MSIDTNLGERSSTKIGHDLSSVACQAAIELDNLILERNTNLPSVVELTNRLTEEVPDVVDLNSSLSLVDPSTMVALHGTLQASNPGLSDEIADLIQRTNEIIDRLKIVSKAPQSANRDELLHLKKFCLVLSQRASAASEDPDEARTPHPYRS